MVKRVRYTDINGPRGFSIVELLVVIAIIGILSSVIVAVASGSQASSRDTARTTDVETIARQFERNYTNSTSVGVPTYPTTTQVTSSQTTIMNGSDLEALNAPGKTSSSLIAAGSTAAQTPTKDQYIYLPFTASDTLCSTAPCVRFRLYYRTEVDNTVRYVDSQYQQ